MEATGRPHSIEISGGVTVRKLCPWSLVIFLLTSACSGGDSANPLSPAQVSPAAPPTPLPNGDRSGRIESAEVAADLITYNQEVNVGLSIPVEGAIERAKGIITRWELPIPVYVDASIVGDCAQNALDYWASATGLTFTLVAAAAEPRVVIRAAGPDELNVAAGSGLVYRTFPDNSARLGVVKILTSEARCSAPSALFRHEIGHAIGIFGHVPGGLMSSPPIGTTASQREVNILTQLYRLPHGTQIAADGTWKVVR
jgi:hypothetical protein